MSRGSTTAKKIDAQGRQSDVKTIKLRFEEWPTLHVQQIRPEFFTTCGELPQPRLGDGDQMSLELRWRDRRLDEALVNKTSRWPSRQSITPALIRTKAMDQNKAALNRPERLLITIKIMSQRDKRTCENGVNSTPVPNPAPKLHMTSDNQTQILSGSQYKILRL